MKKKNGFGFNLIWAVVVLGIVVSLIGALGNPVRASTGNIYINTTQVQANGTTITGPGNLIIQDGGDLITNTGHRFTINMGGDVIIHAGGRITGNVHIIAANIIIHPATATLPAGTIDVRGFAGGGRGHSGLGPGGGGRGVVVVAGAVVAGGGGGGAGHGAFGAFGMTATGVGVGARGLPYGSLYQPVDLGSGGGGGMTGLGGGGGGAIRLDISGVLTINGTIAANGQAGSWGGGGGSGGSILISAGTITGIGAIQAHGGDGSGAVGGAGAGGRIAIYYTNKTHTGAITASGGAGPSGAAGNGTIVIVNSPLTINSVTTPTSLATQIVTGTVKDDLTVTMSSTTPGTTFGNVAYDRAVCPDTWNVVVTLVEGSNVITATTSPDAAGNTAVASATIAMFVGGDGSAANPFRITNWHHLSDIRHTSLSSHFILMNDLDETTLGYAELASSTANGGAGWLPIGTDAARFTGNFNGNGREIRSLFINRSTTDHVGLFGVVGTGGIVANVGMVNVNVTGRNAVGGLVGWSVGSVGHSSATGSVFGTGWYVGGLVGLNTGTVANSYAASVSSGSEAVGGLVGENRGTVSNSYATGSVTGTVDEVGGLVGRSTGTIANSYSTGSVTAPAMVGGLIGSNTGTVTNSFWNTETSGQATSAGGTSMTTAQMRTLASFTGVTPAWDIVAVANGGVRDTTSIWNIVDGVTYPLLSWKSPFSGGDGSAGNPFQITNWQHLNNIRHHLASHFILMDNLDSTTTGYAELASPTANGGAGWLPIGTHAVPFTGIFNGGGREIRDLFINLPNGWHVGLFGVTGSAGVIENVGVVNANVTGRGVVGGLVGTNLNIVRNSFVTGSVSGVDQVGGLVGSNGGDVTNSYATGSMSGTTNVGGLVGWYGGGTVTNSYFLEGTAVSGIGGGTGEVTSKTEAQFTSGEVAWLLQGEQEDFAWGHTVLSGGEFPRLAVEGSEVEQVFRISFESQEPTHQSSGYLLNGDLIVFPNLERTGHIVTWEDINGDEYPGGSVISSDLELTAQWEVVTEIQRVPEFSVKLGPNPIRNNLIVTISDADEYIGRVVRLSVYDSRGRAFRRKEVVINGVYDEVEVEVSQLPAGVCFVVLEVEGFDAKRVTFAKVDG